MRSFASGSVQKGLVIKAMINRNIFVYLRNVIYLYNPTSDSNLTTYDLENMFRLFCAHMHV